MPNEAPAMSKSNPAEKTGTRSVPPPTHPLPLNSTPTGDAVPGRESAPRRPTSVELSPAANAFSGPQDDFRRWDSFAERRRRNKVKHWGWVDRKIHRLRIRNDPILRVAFALFHKLVDRVNIRNPGLNLRPGLRALPR